jgi:hypothetical protein
VIDFDRMNRSEEHRLPARCSYTRTHISPRSGPTHIKLLDFGFLRNEKSICTATIQVF